ncbi:MAG: FAD-binding oxidoreductase [Acidobacteriota bacterium]
MPPQATPSTTSPATSSYWIDSASLPSLTKADHDGSFDVVVGGAGLTGLTAAYLLARAGKSVTVLERGRAAAIDTGHTSAHLTMVTDMRLTELVDRFGRDHAQAAWDAGLAGLAAMARIEEIVRDEQVQA